MDDIDIRLTALEYAKSSRGEVEFFLFAERVRCFIENEEFDDDGGSMVARFKEVS